MKATPSSSFFNLEPLEPRILLSAEGAELLVPGAGEVVEVVMASDPVETNAAAETSDTPSLAGEELYPVPEAGTLTVRSDGVWTEDGRLLAAELAGLSLAADSVVFEDGVSAEGMRISAGSIYMGEVQWSGGSTLESDALTLTGAQRGTEGSTLTLQPRRADASISLGAEAEGFSLTSGALAYLSGSGIGELVVGRADGSHVFTIDGLSFDGALTLRAPAEGGEYNITGTTRHSGGALTFDGSGHTENIAGDIISSGVPILIEDSLQLVEDPGETKFFGPNTFYLDTTDDGANPFGADIVITGNILGTGVDGGGILYLNAGTTGNILVQGDIGVTTPLDRMVVINANHVNLEGSLLLNSFSQRDGQGDTIFGLDTTDDFQIGTGNVDIDTRNNITFNGDVSVVEGDIDLTADPASPGSAKIHFRETLTTQDGDLIIRTAKSVEFTKAVDISGVLTQQAGTQTTVFRADVDADSVEIHTDLEIRFEAEARLAAGDMILVSNDVNLTGGAATIIGALDGDNLPLSHLRIRPVDDTVSMDLGSPTGGSGVFQFTTTDIAALADGFASITFGYATGSTNSVSAGNAIFTDPLTVYGGAFLVNGTFNSRASMLLDAAVGGIEVSNTQVRVSNDQVGSVWQSSVITLLAHQGDIDLTNGGSLTIDNNDNDDLSQGSEIFLTATAGSIRNAAGSFGFVTARDLVAQAAGDIVLLTQIKNLTASSTSAGDIRVDELDDLHVASSVTADGSHSFTSGGDTLLDFIESQTDHAANTVDVTVFNGNLSVGEILAGTLGDITLDSEGFIRGYAPQTDPHLVGNQLTLAAADGVGEAGTPLLLLVNGVAGTNSTAGPVVLRQLAGRAAFDVSIDNDATGVSDHVSLTVLGGDTTVTAAGIHNASAAGILIDVADNLTVDGDVLGAGGALTILVGGNAGISFGVELSSGGGDVLADVGGNLTQQADASILSAGGNLAVDAGGDIQLGLLDARNIPTPGDASTWGDVAVTAVGFIRDEDASALMNIFARNLRLRAGTGIGQLDGVNERGLEIDAVLLSAHTATGDIALKDSNALTTGNVASFTPNILLENGGTDTAAPTISQDAVLNSGGGDILLSAGALLTLQATTAANAVFTNGAGAVSLIGNAVTAEAAVRSVGGDLSLRADNLISLVDAADLLTTGAGNIAVQSAAGGLQTGAAQRIATGSGTIMLSAQADLMLGEVGTTGAVGLRAVTGVLRAATGGIDTRTVVTGGSLAIVAGNGVDGPMGGSEEFRTDVDTLSLTGGNGDHFRIRNLGTLAIDTTSAAASLYDAILAASTLEIAAQSDVAISGNGNVEIVFDAGDGILAAGRTITTNGAGHILLEAGLGFTMRAGSLVSNENGPIDITAQNHVAVASVTSIDGDITVSSATGSIFDNDPAEAPVDFATQGQLDLTAATGVGILSGDRQTLAVLLGTLRAETATGGIFVHSEESFATNGLITTGGTSPIGIHSIESLTLGPNGDGITVSSTGDVLLNAGDALEQLVGGIISSDADILFSAPDGLITLVEVQTPGVVTLYGTVVTGVPGTTAREITAQGLLLYRVGVFGSAAQPMRLAVSRLAGEIGAGTLVFENDGDLSVGIVTAEFTPFEPDGPLPGIMTVGNDRLTVLEIPVHLSVVPDAGEGVFANIEGSLAVEAGTGSAFTVADAIPVLWETTGTQTWGDAFTLGGGALTLRSGADLNFTAGGVSSSGGGDMLLDAASNFNLALPVTLQAGAGSLLARVGDTLLINGGITSTASVGLIAEREISVTAIGGPTRVTAADLLLNAGYRIATGLLPLITNVDRLTAESGAGGVYVANTGDLEIANLGFAVPSLHPDASRTVAFSGHQGGVLTEQAGAVGVNTTGSLTVQEVSAVIEAFSGTENAISIVADATGPAGNGLSILFDIVESGTEGDPPTTVFTPLDGILTVTLREGVSTLQQIVDAINTDIDFPAAAVLAGGPLDGSQVFTLDPGEEFAFFAEGGRREGVLVGVSAVFEGGAEPISATAQLLLPGEFYNFRFTALNPGDAANAYQVRLLDDGPTGNLTAGTDEAQVVWNEVGGLLDIYINYGFTSVGTVLDAVTDANTNQAVPFSASLEGFFLPSDLDDILGDGPVTLQSNLSANATLRPTGANNDFEVVSAVSGPLYNGIAFEFVDDGSVATLGVRANFNPVTNLMTVFVQSGATTANQVLSALNTEGTFTASLVEETGGGVNSGAGPVQASRFVTRGGAVAVNSSATLAMVGDNNDLVITADVPGVDENGLVIRLVEDVTVGIGSATASYDAVERVLELRLNPGFATAGNVLTAINALAGLPYTAALAAGNNGFGGIELAAYPMTSGGTGGPARADFIAGGPNNDFELEAESTSPLLENIVAYLIDDGSITDGSATVQYLETPRHLIMNVQSGVTTLNTLLAVLNADTAVPVNGGLLTGNDGTGVFNIPAQPFTGGVDPIPATASTLLPSGEEIVLEAEVGGVAQNGIQVVYAIDPSLPIGTAAATLFEVEDLRLLQIRTQSASTTFTAIQNALDIAGLPFFVSNLGGGAQTVGGLAPRTSTVQEGNARLSADGDIRLAGRVQSQTGRVTLQTFVDGDLSFDSETSRVVAVSAAEIDLAGSFVNAASLESPLVKVYGDGLLRILAESAATPSLEPVRLESGGDLTIGGTGGMALTDVNLDAIAGGSITLSGPVNAGTGNIVFDAGDGIVFTPTGSASGTDLGLTAGTDIEQNGNLTAVGAGTLTVESAAGSILMGADAVSQSDTGAITYTAAGDIGVTSIVSTSGNIDLVAGGAITDTHASNGTNLATAGVTTLTAQTGIGAIGTGDLKTGVGDLQLRNLGATGDIVVTETAAGGNLAVTELTQNAASGWSIITVEAGDLAFSGPVTHDGTGSLVVSVNGDLMVQDELNLQGGHLTVGVFGNAAFDQDVNTNGGDVGIVAGGVLDMDPLMTLDTGGGNVFLQAGGNLLLAAVVAADADVRIESTAASILRAAADGRTNVIAGVLQLKAAQAVASLASEADALILRVDRLNATALNGVLAVRELDDLLVGDSSVTLQFAQIDKTAEPGTWSESRLRTVNGAAVVNVDGSLTVETSASDPVVSINGNFRLRGGGVLTLDGDTVVTGGSAHIVSVSDALLNGDLDVDGGTLLLESGGLFTQAAASVFTVVDANAIVSSTGTLSVARIDTGTGFLALTGGADILRTSGAPATQLTAGRIRFETDGSLGIIGVLIGVTADRASVLAADGIHLTTGSDLEIGGVEVSANTVNTFGATTAPARIESALADLESIGAGNILVNVDGQLTLTDGDADGDAVVTGGAGHVVLEAGSLNASADVRSAQGHINVALAGDGLWGATADLLSTDGDIHVMSGGNATQTDGGRFATTNGSLRVATAGDLNLASVQAPLGLVALEAGGAVLDNGGADIDVVADELQILAGTGIGILTPYNALDIDVNRLAARTTAGPLALNELTAAAAGEAQGSVATVNLDATPGSYTVAPVFGLESQGGGNLSMTAAGNLVIESSGSTLDTDHGVTASGAGNIFLQSSAGLLTVNDSLLTGTGHITLRGFNGLQLGDGVPVDTTGAGTITLISANGAITQNAAGTLTAENGDVVLQAAGNVLVSGIVTNTAVALTSTGGSILDNEALRVNIASTSLHLYAGLGIASGTNPLETAVATISARTLNGAIFLAETDDVDVGATGATTRVVGVDGTAASTPVASQSGLVSGGASGTIVLTSGAGGIHVLSGAPVTASQAGNILLSAPGDLTVDAAVSSGTGSITLATRADFTLAGAVLVTTGGAGQLHVFAFGNLTSGAESRFVNGTGNVALAAEGELLLGGINSSGRAALSSENGSVRGAGSTTFNHEVIAKQLLLSALNGGVGTLSPDTVRNFRTRVGRVAGEAGGEGLNLVNDITVSVDAVSVTLQWVVADGSVSALPTQTFTDLKTLSGNGSIVLRTSNGSVTLNDGGDADGVSVSAHGAGNVRIYASVDVTANADVLSGTGHVTLRAAGSLSLGSGADVATGTPGTVYLKADSGTLAMTGASTVTATGSSLLLEASGDVTIGSLTGDQISVNSINGSVLGASGSVSNFTGTGLRIGSNTDIGSPSAPLTTGVSILSAVSHGGGIYIEEVGDVDIGTVGVTVREVLNDASTAPVSTGSQSGLATTAANGPVVLVSTGGAVTVNQAVSAHGDGNLLLQAATLLTVNANVTSGGGDLSLRGGTGLVFAAGVTVATGVAGSLDLDAGTGGLTMDGTTVFTAPGGSVRLAAEGDILVGVLTSANASLLTSGGGIFNNAGGLGVNLTTGALRLEANNAIGLAGTPLRIAASYVAALSRTGGIFLTETDNITVDDVNLTTPRVGSDASTTPVVDVELQDLTSGPDGDIVLVSLGGAITLNDGGDEDGLAVEAGGAGDVTLDADGNLNVNAGVSSGSGTLRLNAGDNLFFGIGVVGVTTGAPGEIVLKAAGGAVTMTGLTQVTATGSALRVAASGDLTLGNLSAEGVSLLSGLGAIRNAAGSGRNVTAATLRFSAATGVGTTSRFVTTNVETLAGRSTQGDLLIQELNEATVGTVEVTVDGVTDAALNGLLTQSSGDIVLLANGLLILDQPVTSAEHVRLSTGGELRLGAVTGIDVSLIAGGAITNPGGGDPNVTSNRLRMQGAGSIGEQGLHIAVDVDTLSAWSSGGGVYLTASGNTVLGPVAVTAGGATDAAQHGVSSALNVELSAPTGTFLDGGEGAHDVATPQRAVISALNGLGRTGNGAVEVDATELEFTASGDGSVYLNLVGTTEILVFDMPGMGYLYLNAAGGLTQSGPLTVAQGSAVLKVSGAYLSTAELGASRDLRLMADGVTLGTGGRLLAETGDLSLRSSAGLTMAAGTSLDSPNGLLALQTVGNATVGLLTAGRGIVVDIGGDLNAASADRATHEFSTRFLRLRVGGHLFSILTRVERLDVQAGGVGEIHEFDNLTAGRFGFDLVDPTVGDAFTLRLNAATLNSLRDRITLDDDVVLTLMSGQQVTLASALEAPAGDIRLNVAGLTVDPSVTGNQLRAALGNVSVTSTAGVGVGAADPLRVNASTFDAAAATGNIAVRFASPVTLNATGVKLNGGAGKVTLAGNGGTLTLGGRVLHDGTGDIAVTSTGGIRVNANNFTGPVIRGNRLLSLNLDAGTLFNGGNDLAVSAPNFWADTRTGTLRFRMTRATRIETQGLRIREGSGEMVFRVVTGNLTMAANAQIRNLGQGTLNIQVDGGAFTMGTTNTISNQNNSLLIFVQNTFTIGQIVTRGNFMNVRSETGDLLGLDMVNIVIESSHIPELSVSAGNGMDLTVDGDAVLVNGTRYNRGSKALLEIDVTF